MVETVALRTRHAWERGILTAGLHFPSPAGATGPQGRQGRATPILPADMLRQ